MSTGDERLDAVEDRIDEAKEAADRVEDNEGLGLRHRETDQHGTVEPLGRRPSSAGRGLGAGGAADLGQALLQEGALRGVRRELHRAPV